MKTMRKKRTVSNPEESQKPDCCVCIRRNGCERYQENSFCTRFQSAEPDPQGVDPNRLWEQGEEVDF